MTSIVPFNSGSPMSPEHRAALRHIRANLKKYSFPLNAEGYLATAIVGIIDALLPGIEVDDDKRASG